MFKIKQIPIHIDSEIKEIDFIVNKICTSDNLVKLLPNLKETGKIYVGKNFEEIKEKFDNRENVRGPIYKYRNYSLFDLLTPLLMPSINFDLPDELNLPNKLFDYQVQGVKFLISNEGCLLADQMGTGKTVMTTTALRILFIKGVIKKTLIVVPSSLISVWEEHISKWAPELNFVTIMEGKRQRDILWSIKSHIYIVSYDTLKNDYKEKLNILREFSKDLDIIVLDEAHNIKNRETSKSRAVKFFAKKAKFRWALSGTPLQNNLRELISLYEFLKPDEKLPEKITQEEARDLIKPIMLRRLKKEILTQLPEKLPPEIERFNLSPLQREYYEKFLHSEQRRLSTIFERYKNERNFVFMMKQNIIFSIQKLRQICNFAPESIHSPKADRMIEIVKEIIDNKDKVVIFSNFITEGIDKIVKSLRSFLNPNNIAVYHGSLNKIERDKAVKSFMENDECKVFVGTITAAGEGLTLTAGSYVIFFDLHWNPAKMWQAEDRVHRIGQNSKVNIYKFVTNDTIEDHILQRLKQKEMMIDSVIDSDINEIESITLDELLDFMGLKLVV
ncbi:MAG: DEAD/DEAH box helicase [Hydrogenothermaceae bacterium]|nr:DEAD/DEAH box helicase [Hydrogenothermaceae bacterium]